MDASDYFDRATPCFSRGCTRIAYGFHRYCCSECKHCRNGAHGRRCLDRQRMDAEGDDSGASTEEATVQSQVENLRKLVEVFLPSLSLESRIRWLKDLIRTFHPDRNTEMISSHACTQLLIETLEKQI